VTPADLEAIRRVVREELARALDSGRRSPLGVGVPGHGDQSCPRESMDPTLTDNDGECDSSEDLAALANADIDRLRRGLPLSNTRPSPRARRSKGAR
jgi:hypothetical protein